MFLILHKSVFEVDMWALHLTNRKGAIWTPPQFASKPLPQVLAHHSRSPRRRCEGQFLMFTQTQGGNGAPLPRRHAIRLSCFQCWAVSGGRFCRDIWCPGWGVPARCPLWCPCSCCSPTALSRVLDLPAVLSYCRSWWRNQDRTQLTFFLKT